MPEITDYDFIASAIGNAYFSGVSYEQLWSCIALSKTREDLDVAIAATINLNELMRNENYGK